MADRFPIDPTNPGEILACAGLASLTAQHSPGAATGFSQEGGRWVFTVETPVEALKEITESRPKETGESIQLSGLLLDWWNPGHGLNPAFKFWAGQQSARSVLTNLLQAARGGSPEEWLEFQAPTTGRLGVDHEGTWDSLSLGWSVNEHNDLKYLCRPFVELLAFIALQRFPVQGSRDDGFFYHTWAAVPPDLAPLAFAGASRHSLACWQTEIADSGSNKYLKPAHPRETTR